MIASEYGWTFEQILNLSEKEVIQACECIHVRRHNNFVAQASLHGKKLAIKYNKQRGSAEQSEFNKKEDKVFSKRISQRIKSHGRHKDRR